MKKIGIALIILLSVLSIVSLFYFDPIAQDNTYHNFADQREIFGIANLLNVASNLPFLIVGWLGVYMTINSKLHILEKLKMGYMIMFCGLIVIFIGSSYYHLMPNNESLVWDRLTMAVVFMSLFSIIVSEFVSMDLGKKLLFPFIVVGIASVVYWHMTEQIGVGDLRFYGLVQFLPIMIIVAILIFFKSNHKSDVYAYTYLLIAYAVAKVFEYYDAQVYEYLILISGHSIKHVIAAVGLYMFLIKKRIALKR